MADRFVFCPAAARVGSADWQQVAVGPADRRQPVGAGSACYIFFQSMTDLLLRM